MTTSWVATPKVASRTQMPSPGADCPARVRYGDLTVIGDFNAIVPATRKTTMRGPVASHAARKLPGPLSFRFVTMMTFPPRPPGVVEPKPSAPGKAGRLDSLIKTRVALVMTFGCAA